MRQLFICISLLIGSASQAYNLENVSLPKYPFINEKYADIQVPGNDSTRLNSFFRKIDGFLQTGQGQINILHIGGSHVQAGMFSNRVRRHLDALNDTLQTPRGLIFPFAVAKTNNPANYKVTYSGEWQSVRNVQKNREIPVGMCGIAVYTNDSSARIKVALNPTDDNRWHFTRLRLMGSTLDGSNQVCPALFYQQDTLPGYFDEISASYLFYPPEPQDTFCFGLLQLDTVPHAFIVNGFIPENNTTDGIVYHAIGVNGASVPSYLQSEYFEDELPFICPDLVVFGIGINDATASDFSRASFRRNYNELITRIKRVNPDCVFIFITNNDSYRRISRRNYRVNTNGQIAREVFYDLAKEHQGGVWDLYAWMGGLRSMYKWYTKGLGKQDRVHFTASGYQFIGDAFYNAFIDYIRQIESPTE